MNAIVDHPVGFSSVDFASFLKKCGLFLLGAIVGIASFVGVLRIGEAEAERTGSYTATPAISMRDAGDVTTPHPSSSSALISAGRSDTNSFFSDYRLERDACCPGE
jgi:hypothetical protein